MAAEPRLYRFGPFELDVRAGELTRGGRRLRLPAQSAVLLHRLVERPGDVVTREELRAALWPDGTHVDYEHGLNNAAARLRRVLGDPASAPRFVETLPRTGYRFIAPVRAVTAAPATSVAAMTEVPSRPAPRRLRAPAVVAAAFIFVAGAAGGLLVSRWSAAAPAARPLTGAQEQAERSLIYTRMVLDGELPAGLVYDVAHATASRALARDATLAEAHVAAGYVAMWGRWDWALASRHFDTAQALAPSSARARQARALWLSARERHAQARQAIADARRLDPESIGIARDEARIAFVAGDARAAVDRLRALLAAHPDDIPAHELMSEALASLGRNAEAAHYFGRFLVLIGIGEAHARADGRLLAARGMAGLMRRNLSRPSGKPPDRYGVPFKLAASHAIVGEVDAALTWLEQAIGQRDSRLLWLRVHPRFEPLRADPRFQTLLARVGL
jgi:DNA-binding winged helix-turn-helix (wHTH) protein